jgi:Second Messenger Oligonucleotide or Dinucleotide Synthetase domain
MSHPVAKMAEYERSGVMASIIGHSEIKGFAEDRVNLSRAMAQKHRDQVNALRGRLDRKIDADPDYGLVKMLHSGSVAKGTALRDVHDLDTAVYVVEAEAPTGNDRRLVPWLADRLYEANTNMKRDQFVENEHSVTVKFRGTGLDVDVVPVLYEGDDHDVGYLVRKRTGKRVLTSIPLHLRFIRERKAKYGTSFAELIRLTKWWKGVANDRDEDFRFKSFMIELLWAHLADRGLSLADYPKALERFFAYVVKTELGEQVAFTDFCTSKEIPARSGAVIEVLDPVNVGNNVAELYGAADRERIVGEAHRALSALNEARFAPTKGWAVECWQKVLGPTFKG